ncbi:MAG TPA: nucleotide disphospho-sugar-binding domain-containing protein [Cytophagaceae bacterium]|jgi:UDP:flavonoid glycosyltransferase YjiC (YdhE family)
MKKHKLLFISEDITLSQVVRLVELAKSVSGIYEIHFASSHAYPFVFNDCEFTHWKLTCITSDYMQKKLDKGAPIYSETILLGYVEQELHLYDQIKPDLIISDFRWSVSISAPYAKISYAIIINSYWNLNKLDFRLPIPNHPISSVFGHTTSQFFFQYAVPLFFYLYALPVNRLRKKFNLPKIGTLQDVLTKADFTLYPDTPLLSPLNVLGPKEIFLGPVVWSPDLNFDFTWKKDIDHLPLVYYTPGSSGNKKLNHIILERLAKMPVRVLFSSAGDDTIQYGSNIIAAPLIPGNKACKNASLVICNGGSSTAYQSLYEGTPVLGIPSNLDQQISAKIIQRTGAGLLLNNESVSRRNFTCVVSNIIGDNQFKTNAQRIQDEFREYDYKAIFPRWLKNHLRL